MASTQTATATGAAAFKKKQGMLSVYEDTTPPMLSWRAIDTNNVEVKLLDIALDQVTNLQLTPATSAKLALNIITGERKNVFAFNSRDTMNEIKLLLQQIMARKKQDSEKSTTPIPQTQVVNDEFLLNLLDARKLLKNHQLQQKLLKENKKLMGTFREAVMQNGLDPQEFWNTRIHLLRSYAIQNNQQKGSYNVLSTIKPVATSDNEVNVSVTREKIHSIFDQYPIVRKIYNDNVPKRFGEGVFWSRFFSSKLFRKLRGEKNFNNAKVDSIFDKYLYVDPDFEGDETDIENQGSTSDQHHVNALIDLNGNELDVSEKFGNGPDYTMKFTEGPDVVSIFKSMNRLSSKMINNASPLTTESPDHEMELELELSDLEDKEQPEYNELLLKNNLKQSNEFKIVENEAGFKKFVIESVNQIPAKIDLRTATEDSGSIMDLSKDISTLIRLNSKQSKQSWQLNLQMTDDVEMTRDDQEEEISLGSDLLENLRIVHSTSIEFEKHFWFNLQEAKVNVKIVNNLYHSLQKSLERIEAIFSSITDEQDLQTAKLVMNPLMESLNYLITYYQNLSKLEQ